MLVQVTSPVRTMHTHTCTPACLMVSHTPAVTSKGQRCISDSCVVYLEERLVRVMLLENLGEFLICACDFSTLPRWVAMEGSPSAMKKGPAFPLMG